MERYYDSVAPAYDRIYEGDGSGGETLFQHDAAAIGALLPALVGRRHVDLACGTGWWLQFYHRACERITLIDRSPRMLEECRKKIEALGLQSKTALLRADLLEDGVLQDYDRKVDSLSLPFPPGGYDSALLGFFWSHLTAAEEDRLIAGVRATLAPGGRLLLVDSAWSPERAAARQKSSVQARTLPDGRSFNVRKRYLDENDLKAMEARHGMSWRALYEGKAFLLAEGRFNRS
jgi:SAM-dependent methyltransferase